MQSKIDVQFFFLQCGIRGSKSWLVLTSGLGEFVTQNVPRRLGCSAKTRWEGISDARGYPVGVGCFGSSETQVWLQKHVNQGDKWHAAH